MAKIVLDSLKDYVIYSLKMLRKTGTSECKSL